jgi:hypothetical protein
MNVKYIFLAAAISIAPAAVFAQTTPTPAPAPAATSTPTPGKNDYNINQRKADQQQRIGNGIKDGQITPGQASKLEHQESGINKEERGMRAQDNGHLTKQDRQTIHKQQNQESRRIYRDRHDGK